MCSLLAEYPRFFREKLLIEPNSLSELQKIPNNLRVVWNSRDLKTGGRKQETFEEARTIFKGWLCQASNITTVADIHPRTDAVIVGTKLLEFSTSLNIKI